MSPADPRRGRTRHHLTASPDNVRVGLIDAAYPAVLTIDSGDEVTVETAHLYGGEVTATTTVAEMMALRKRYADAGALGPHTLTGPIAVRGARPGDVLRIDILELVPGPHGYNLMPPAPGSRGALADRFPEGSIRHYELDAEALTTEALPGLNLPLRPFLGIIGVAPESDGPIGTAAPGRFGGNIDLTDLIVGTSLSLPVFREGARAYIGDAHALQGDGEVDQTALETTMTARLRFTVEHNGPISGPRAETPTHVIVLAFDHDLDEAARNAVDDATDLIAARLGVPAVEAYRLCSLAVDLAVTQIVNGVKGVHAKVPKALLGG